MNRTVAACVDRCEAAIAQENDVRLRDVATTGAGALQRFVDKASAIIHGHEVRLDQGEIDALIAG